MGKFKEYSIDLRDRHKMDDYAIDINRPYEKYKKHCKSLVNFGSLSQFMMDKYLKNFMNREHTEAIVYNIGFNRIKELFPEIEKEDLDDIMIGYLMVADLGVIIGNKVQNSMNNFIEEKELDVLLNKELKEIE